MSKDKKALTIVAFIAIIIWFIGGLYLIIDNNISRSDYAIAWGNSLMFMVISAIATLKDY